MALEPIINPLEGSPIILCTYQDQ